ncbi:MAG: hypothetical protein GWP19_11070 [Planctomycetia bacterium]|nr:hypothetical protein [Planctomycetia bacterium]
MGHKATDIEKARRLIELEPLLLRGFSYNKIVEYCRNKFKIKHAETSKYIAEIKESWIKRQDSKREKNLAEAIERRDDMYYEARQNKDIRAALSVDDSLRNLQGLNEENINIKSEVKLIHSKEDDI